jgi:hypothetical protein
MNAAGADCRYEELHTSHGHDGFLADAELLTPLLRAALADEAPAAAGTRRATTHARAAAAA